MNRSRQDATPIIAAGLTYWSGWVEQLNRVPTPAFLGKHDLIKHTAKMAVKIRETRQAATELVLLAFPLIEASGHWPEWVSLLETLTSHFDDINQELRPIVLNRLGQLYRMDRRFSGAVAMHHDAFELAVQLAIEGLMQGAILHQLAEDYRQLQRFDLAKEYILRAMQFVTHGPRSDMHLGMSSYIRSQIELAAGDVAEATVWLEKSIEVFQRINQPVELARAYTGYGQISMAQGQFDKAIEAYQKSLLELERASSPAEVALAKYNIGCGYMNLEQYEQAEAVFREAAVFMRQQIWMPLIWQVQNTHNLGHVIVKQGRFSEAEAFLRESEAMWMQMGDELGLASCWDSLAEALCKQGRLEEGCRLYRKALALLAKYPDNPQAQAMVAEFSQPYAAFNCEELVD